MTASLNGNTDVVQLLLDKGANIDYQDSGGGGSSLLNAGFTNLLSLSRLLTW